METDLRSHLERELASARSSGRHRDWETAWTHLERAHILSQADPWAHTRVHWRMLLLGVAQRHPREIVGQAIRTLLAAPSSALGRAPLGNTGRSHVGLFTPMPIPEDLQTVLDREAHGRNAKRSVRA